MEVELAVTAFEVTTEVAAAEDAVTLVTAGHETEAEVAAEETADTAAEVKAEAALLELTARPTEDATSLEEEEMERL